MTIPRALLESLARALAAPTLARFAELAGRVMTELLTGWECARAQHRDAALEARVLALLTVIWVSRTELHKRLGGHVLATELEAALGRLEARGAVVRRVMRSSGRPRAEYRLLRTDGRIKPFPRTSEVETAGVLSGQGAP